MAHTAAGAALSTRHRQQQLALRAVTLRDLTRLWPLFSPTDLGTFERFAAAASVLVVARHRDSAGLAAGYYAAFRAAEGVPGRAQLELPPPVPREVVSSSLRATGLLGVLNARRAGQSLHAAAQNGLVRAAGSATSLVLHGARDTILGAVRADEARPRWRRTTSSSPCSFCRMLAGRGAVYARGDTAGFEAHDHCACTPEPAF